MATTPPTLALCCPNCESTDSWATNETLTAISHADITINTNGIDTQHTGSTDVFWDTSTTNQTRPYHCSDCVSDFTETQLLHAAGRQLSNDIKESQQ